MAEFAYVEVDQFWAVKYGGRLIGWAWERPGEVAAREKWRATPLTPGVMPADSHRLLPSRRACAEWLLSCWGDISVPSQG